MVALAKNLREAVFQAAIQGKLTTQLPDDGDAKECFIQIKEKKATLQGNKKDKAPTLIQEDDILFDIPKNWCWCKLGDITQIIRGLTFKKAVEKKECYDGYSLVCRGGNIDSKTEKIQFDDNIYVPSTIIKEEQFIKKDDCLIVASSGTKTSVGKSTLIEKEYPNVTFGGFMMVVRPIINIEPLLLSIHMKLYRSKIIAATNGYISNITLPILSNLLIPLPPVTEQKRIVSRVKELMQLIDEYEQIENQLIKINEAFPNDIKISILQAAMQGKLTKQLNSDSPVPFDADVFDEEPFEIPDNWVWCKLGNVATTQMGKTPPRAEGEWWGKDVSWVSIADMPENDYLQTTKEYVSNKALSKIFKNRVSPAGTLLMSFKLTIGRASILDIDAVHNEAIISIFPKKDINNNFRDYLFKILPIMSQYGEDKNAIKGKTLNKKSIFNIPIPVPPIEEQRRIVDVLDKLLPLCNTL